jgi:MoaA/NifB/PqqE/SkfB family radical SAM enzyme
MPYLRFLTRLSLFVCGRPPDLQGLETLNLVLTESCNLDCWMCDFGRRNKRTKDIPLSIEEILNLLDHPVFSGSLKSMTLTGGEPFLFPGTEKLYLALRDRKPGLKVNFSSNATLLPRMIKVFDHIRDWNKVSLFVSVDGIRKHNEQRGTEGSLELTVRNLKALRARYPLLPITLKFTITPINYVELEATFRHFQFLGYRITAKMVENNPYYTNSLSHQKHQTDFRFTEDQFASLRSQLKAILRDWPALEGYSRREVKEVLESLDPKWKRPDGCVTPEKAAFIDCDLNFFTCKEYPPVLNLKSDDLSNLANTDSFRNVVNHQKCNTGQCTRCTSPLKIRGRRK